MPDAPPILDPNAPPAAAGAANANGNPPTDGWVNKWVKEDGSFDHSVFDKAPDDFKGMKKEVERYKTVPEYLKAQREREALLGKKGIVDPLPENATQAQKDERSALLRRANGVPDKPEGYALAKPEGVADNMWDQKYADSIAAVAHKHGVSPAALKELAAAELGYAKGQMEANQKAETVWFEGQDKLIRETLIKEGMDFPKGKDLAERAGRKLGVDPANPLMKNATVFMLLARIGNTMKEDTLVTGDTSESGLSNMSAEQATAAANAIQTDKTNPDYKAFYARDADKVSEKDHQAAVAKVARLRAIAAKGK